MPSTSMSLGSCVSSSATRLDSLAVAARKGRKSSAMNSPPARMAATSSATCVSPWLVKLASASLT
jgi:hypothetical protein